MTFNSMLRTRWAAVGAAVAITLGAVGLGGLNIASADVSDGDRPVFIPINPCRLLDTRAGDNNVGPKTSPLGPGETYTVTAHGDNGECTGASTIPSDALSISLNVTAVGATGATFLTFWGEGSNPGTSNLNPRPGAAPTPNSVNTPLSASGTFNIYNEAGTVDIIADVNGYYAGHDHDDRYYTEEESDGRYVTEAEADARFAPAAADITQVNIFDFDLDPTTGWELGLVPSHSASASTECTLAPVDLPVGRTIESMSVSYIASADATVDVTLYKALDAVGTFAGVDEILGSPVAGPGTVFAATASSTVGSVTVDATREIVDARASYVAVLCTQDDISIIGTSVSTPLV